MKMMSKKLLVLGLLVCILSIASSDTAIDSKNNDVTKSDDQTKPTITDIGKAADPSLNATKSNSPITWIITNLIYYGFRYFIYTPISLAIQTTLAPILIPYYVITIPIKFLFGRNIFINIGRTILRLALKIISFGSGSAAKTISGAMRLILNGVTGIFTDIGLPVANTAEQLSKLTGHLAKSRSRRAIGSAFSSLIKGVFNLIKFPFLLAFNAISLPFRIIYTIISWPIKFIFGGDNSTYTLLLTDKSTERFANLFLTTAWNFMRETGIPRLAALANRLKDNESIPNSIRVLLSEFVAVYNVMQMLGYVK